MSKNLFNSKIFEVGVLEYRVLNDESLYQKVTQVLSTRGIFIADIFKYCFKYQDTAGFKVFLEALKTSWQKKFAPVNKETIFQEKNLLPPSGFSLQSVRFLGSKLLSINRNFDLKDFWPLIKAKQYSDQGSLNADIDRWCQSAIEWIAEGQLWINAAAGKPYRAEAKLIGSVALILASREIEAKNWWDLFGPETQNHPQDQSSAAIQLDYLDAWMDLKYGFENDFSLAKQICPKYLNHPIIEWRNKFIDIANEISQLDDAVSEDNFSVSQKKTQNSVENESEFEEDDSESEVLEQANDTSKSESPKTSASSEHKFSLEASIKDSAISISSLQVSELKIHFYKIDLEVLLSKNPALKLQKFDVGFLKPTQLLKVSLERPAELRN